MLVTKIARIKQAAKIYNVIHPAMKKYSFDLISGVVYNFESMRKFFNSAPFFIWTKWSQLSVIKNAINQNGSLDIPTINTFKIYKQIRINRDKLAYKYGHSFYRYILLGYIFSNNKKRIKFVREYIFKNTFAISLYRRKSVATNLVIDPSQYLIWNRDLAERLVKKLFIPLYLYYSLVSKFLLYKVKS